MKKNVLAAALSAILPGAGQIYNHHWVKGIGFLATVMVLSAIVRRRLVFDEPSLMAILVVVVLFGLATWSVVDAYRCAKAA